MDKVNLAEKLGLIREHWTPKVVAELNGQEVKLLLFEPASTLNTGNVVDERTVFEPERI